MADKVYANPWDLETIWVQNQIDAARPGELDPAIYWARVRREKELDRALRDQAWADERAYFDKETFDIRVGRKAKRSHGKGYRAFFNTATLLALRCYINEHAAHKPTIVVIDTPTLGLEHQKSGRNLVTSRDEQGRPVTGRLRNLFDYMIDTGNQGQLIILNNTDATPTSAFDAEDTMELVFGEEEDADRPGFLAEIREEGESVPETEPDENEEDGALFPADALENLE